MAAMLSDDMDELLRPQPNRTFSIHSPDSVWIIRSGRLDLFMIRSTNSELAGARHYLLSIGQGNAAFGMCAPERSGIAVLASPIPGTELLCLSQASFRRLVGPVDPGIDADAITLLEEWISQLGSACSGAPRPKVFTDLIAGTTLEATSQPKPVMPVKGVLWVEHPQGTSFFLNNPETDPVCNGNYFPVSKDGWLQPSPQSRILSLDSKEWVKADPEWRSVQEFHKTFLQWLGFDYGVRQNKERKGLQRQANSDAAILRRAVRTLASPLMEDKAPPSFPDTGVTDPIFLACEAVGESFGIRIVPPPEMHGDLKLKDPLAAIARASALRYRVVALKGKWWTDATSPLVAFRATDNHPLAVLPGSSKGFKIYDPGTQNTIQVNAEVALTLKGFAYAFYRPLPNQKLSAQNLLAFGMQDCKRELLTIVLMGIGGGLLGMVFPIATGIIFDSVIPGAQRNQLLLIAVFMIMSAMAASIFTLTRDFATLRLEGKICSSLQAAIWDRLLRLPLPFFRGFTSGDLADRSLGIENIIRTLTGAALSSILSGLFSIFSFLLLFYYSWQLAVIASGLTLTAIGVSIVSAYFQLNYQRQILRARGRISGILLEFMRSIAKLRVSGTEPRAFAAWAREFAAQKTLSMRARGISNGLTIFNSAFPVISLAIIFSFATHLMGQPLLHALTTGSFLAFLAAFVQFQSAALQLTTTIESVLGIVPLFERAVPIFETLAEVNETAKHPGELTGSIEINHLNFRYLPDMPMVLRDLSLSVKEGQFVALVGPSGSGKSTLLRLLLGFEKPESGAIYYDGQDLAGLDIEAVRRQMGVVIQNARLVSGSIFNNIVGSTRLTLDDAWEAARMAGLEQDIRELPMGMHTLISEGAGNLSGGQRQRLLIARAMVKKPRIFLFDEATSALDNTTQSIVNCGLEALQATRIVVAHRLSTVINADCIYVFEKGMVVQSGAYNELLREKGVFRKFAQRQLAPNHE
jgi:NHLM bacteriocin system ABC transporter ATP-binding protein